MAIHAIREDFTPKPILQGSFKSLQNTHYYLCKFYELAEELPEPKDFCAKVAYLHENSRPPNGKFGFHVVTYNGDLPQENGYTDTREEFFSNGFKHIINLNLERGGPWEQIESLKSDMLNKVIPRLIRPLETNGRSIKPSLVHGDLWCGNAAIDTVTDLPLVYDPSSFYAHHEYELGNWRPERNKFSRCYFNAYHSHLPKSSPEGDYDDRNALYSLRFNLHAAALFPDVESFREAVIDEMRSYVIPAVGLGTFQGDDGNGLVKAAVVKALRNGYKHIDTATAYGNEAEVGDGIRKSGVPRDEVFVTTKLYELDLILCPRTTWITFLHRAQTWHNPMDVEEALDQSLKKLQLDHG
ncbi:MAG: hypothetical protein Q9181_006757 [Wetmoreana brouardii]